MESPHVYRCWNDSTTLLEEHWLVVSYRCIRVSLQRYDGKDIKSLCLNHLRTQVALVGQEPRLFAGTIKDNICFGLGEVPMEQIDKALDLANCRNFLANLPQGIETEVSFITVFSLRIHTL